MPSIKFTGLVSDMKVKPTALSSVRTNRETILETILVAEVVKPHVGINKKHNLATLPIPIAP